MAKKKNQTVVIEDVELQPQVIGYTYRKKSNIGRVFLIFIVLGLVIYFINDISLFFNNLFNKNTATSIQELTNDNLDNNKKEDTNNYFEVNDNLTFAYDDLLFNSFKYSGNTLSFVINNNTNETIDLSEQDVYLITYDKEKKEIESIKLNINTIGFNSFEEISVNIEKDFEYIAVK